jgi:hypothetical protein
MPPMPSLHSLSRSRAVHGAIWYGLPVVAVFGLVITLRVANGLQVGLVWLLIGAAIFAVATVFLISVYAGPHAARLRNLSVSFGCLLLLSAYAGGYHLAATQPQQAVLPYGTILTPATGKLLTPGKSTVVAGFAKNVPPGSQLWLLTYDLGDDSYEIEHSLVVTDQGQWSATATVGYRGEKQRSEDDLVVVLVQSALLEDVLVQDYITDDYEDVPHGLVDENVLCRVDYFVN